jgi:hypothetical protein
VRRFGFGLLFGIVGYLVVAVAGYLLIAQFSGNTHDRSVEAAMTSIFFFGPVGALLGFILGVVRGGRRPAVPPTDDA